MKLARFPLLVSSFIMSLLLHPVHLMAQSGHAAANAPKTTYSLDSASSRARDVRCLLREDLAWRCEGGGRPLQRVPVGTKAAVLPAQELFDDCYRFRRVGLNELLESLCDLFLTIHEEPGEISFDISCNRQVSAPGQVPVKRRLVVTFYGDFGIKRERSHCIFLSKTF